MYIYVVLATVPYETSDEFLGAFSTEEKAKEAFKTMHYATHIFKVKVDCLETPYEEVKLNGPL